MLISLANFSVVHPVMAACRTTRRSSASKSLAYCDILILLQNISMVDGNGEKVQTLIAVTFEGYDAGKVKFFCQKLIHIMLKKEKLSFFLLICASYPSISGLSKIFKSIEKMPHYEGKSTERHEIGRSDSWKMGSVANFHRKKWGQMRR